MAVSPILQDIAQGALDLFVAGKVECMCWSGSQHGDVQASQGSHEPLGLDDPLQPLVHTLVLCLGVWLKALHPGLGETDRECSLSCCTARLVCPVRLYKHHDMFV